MQLDHEGSLFQLRNAQHLVSLTCSELSSFVPGL